jgi:hypothetical protein
VKQKKTSPERVRKARAEARNLLKAIWPHDLPQAAKYIRSNPPSADAIAMLPFEADDLFVSARAKYNASRPHKSQMREEVRQIKKTYGVSTYSELEKKDPEKALELLHKRNKTQLAQLFSKAKLL